MTRDNYKEYPKFVGAYNPKCRNKSCYTASSAVLVAGDNSLFQAAHAIANVVDPLPCAKIDEDGTATELNIIKTNGFTKGFLEPGDRCFFVIKPTHKSGEKYSALERSIDYIYT